MRILSLDVGGSSVKSGIVLDGRIVGEPKKHLLDSKADAESILGDFRSIFCQYEFEALAVAFPGPFDYATGVCLLQGLDKYGELYGRNLKSDFDLNCEIRFCNDAEAAIVGEALYGAGEGADRILGVTLGTGIGSSFLIQGKPQVEGPGVPPNGWLYNQEFEGEMADEIFSIRGIRARALSSFGESREPAEIKEPVFWADFGRDLERFLKPFARRFQADRVLVLGGIGQAYPHFSKGFSEGFRELAVAGELGTEAPLLGAARLFA